MVEYLDGSVIAQLSQPDMRLPIAFCLGRPVRFDHAWGAIDFTTAQSLTFEPPDLDAFPAIPLAYAAARAAGAAPAWLSAANEVAVAAFLHDTIRWTDIVPIVAGVMDQYQDVQLESVEGLVAQDQHARRLASDLITRGR